MWRTIKACLYSCASDIQGRWMGRKTWLSLGAISAQPTQSLFGLMVMTAMKDLESFNVLNVKPLAQRI